MNEPTDAPLVSFVLLAYNQETYIRDALDGAFSQTYSPLEIIVSDDASSDGTYDIMQRMVSDYQGPHRVRLRRSPCNRGIIGHLNDVAAETEGTVLVLAAGDDISYARRTQLMMEVFRREREIMALYSDVAALEAPWAEPDALPLKRHSIHQLLYNGGGVGAGATYAYRRACFEWPVELPDELVSEDRILPLRAALLGEVGGLDLPLIQYRVVPTSLSHQLVRDKQLVRLHRPHLAQVERTILAAHEMGRISRTRMRWLTTLHRTVAWCWGRRSDPERHRHPVRTGVASILRKALRLLNRPPRRTVIPR